MPHKIDTITQLKTDRYATKERQEVYVAPDALLTVTQLAITLGRPLLLRGEPGCGKTRFAYAVAEALGTSVAPCIIKSTMKAHDLLYTFDNIRKLYDAQPGGEGLDTTNQRYVKYGPLGDAIRRAAEPDAKKRVVVLLDEVDKADLDFPNDLLHELDRLDFTVTETGETFTVPDDKPHLCPLVVLTHNDEKPLPGPFLRRCISFEIPFPTESELKAILEAHGHSPEAPLGVTARGVLARLRDKRLDLSRLPGLSEFLDWIRYAEYVKASPEELRQLAYGEALVKTAQDRQRAQEALKAEAGA
jgi:MoxR-like ATPase